MDPLEVRLLRPSVELDMHVIGDLGEQAPGPGLVLRPHAPDGAGLRRVRRARREARRQVLAVHEAAPDADNIAALETPPKKPRLLVFNVSSIVYWSAIQRGSKIVG